jgi:hypothetical protein
LIVIFDLFEIMPFCQTLAHRAAVRSDEAFQSSGEIFISKVSLEDGLWIRSETGEEMFGPVIVP